MVRSLLIALAALLAASSLAAARPSTLSMTCAQATATVTAAGAIVLSTGQYTFDRFVAHVGFCLHGQILKRATAPTIDAPSCHLGYTCEDKFLRRFED